MSFHNVTLDAYRIHCRYPSLYLFEYENFRNDKFKEIREQLRDSCRFCMGSTKVLKKALGTDAATEVRQGISNLAEDIRGQVGLLFTKLSHEEVTSLVDSFEATDYARAGAQATDTITLEAGPVMVYGNPIAHSLEPTLRQHGMPTKLDKGVVILIADYEVCRKDETLKPNQAALLRILGVKMATFKLWLRGMWTDNKYSQLG